MTDVVGELRGVTESFARPTLHLLRHPWAALAVAVFRCAFSRDRRFVQADLLHTQVDAYLADLRYAGIDLPPGTGRSLCLKWMKAKWLFRSTTPEAAEVYSLTSHALEALELVQTLSKDRPSISGSRLTTILESALRQAIEASPDTQSRVKRMNAQIAELEAERDRLAAGGVAEVASSDRMLDGYLDLVDLIRQLPGDFKRVEESVLAMHRGILAKFREDDHEIGPAIDDYLAGSDALMDTAEGRAFLGAVRLVQDRWMLLRLQENLQTILTHPFTDALTTSEIVEFRGTVEVIRRGIDDVLTQRHRLTSTLRDQIVNHDVAKERELDQTLRQLEREITTLMKSAGPRTRIDVPLLPGSIGVLEHLRERFFDFGSAVAPAPLDDVSEDAPSAMSLEQLRQQGGPSLSDLRGQLAEAFLAGSDKTIGEVFNEWAADLRRPVEILGLLHLVAPFEILDVAEGREPFLAIRPDGTQREFSAPRLGLEPDHAAVLAEEC